MTSDAMEPADGNAGSIGAAEADGDTGLGCAAAESVGATATATSLSVPWASRGGKGEDMAPMGSEGSIRAELDSE